MCLPPRLAAASGQKITALQEVLAVLWGSSAREGCW